MTDEKDKKEIEVRYFDNVFQTVDRYIKEEVIRARLEEIIDQISELQFEKADLERWLGQRD